MRVVVTGIQGQVATALTALASDEVVVIPLGRPQVDLERLETLAPALAQARPDVVVSAAAYTAVDQAESEPERARLVNAVAPGVLSEAAARLGCPIVHLSTDYVFDGEKATPYLETDPTGPRTVYGATKLEGEQAVAAANPAHVILRTAWVHAPYGRNFVRTMLRLAEARAQLSVVADQVGCPTYAPDIAEGVLAVARKLLRGEGAPGVYHLTPPGGVSWSGFAEALFEVSRARGGPWAQVLPIPSTDYPTPARRPANSRLDSGKIKAGFGVELPPWRSGLQRCLDGLLAAKDQEDGVQ